MKKSSLFKILYGYILTQIAVLCVTATLLGVTVAKERTEFMQNGETAVSVSAVKQTESTQERITKTLIKDRLIRAVCRLPAPIGNTASLFVCLENFDSK